MNLLRIHDWQERLAAYVESRREKPFSWGAHHCGNWAFGGVEVITGRNLLSAELRVAETRAEVIRAMRLLGDSLKDVTTALMGAEPVLPTLAAIGDIGMVANPSALLICNGDTWLGVGRESVVVLPAESAVCAWKVG
ncbi:DUF6950 family protein [Methylibium sp.]|uniref:DUF6950 family protein n=1 Tax=Methylibium sp. TaxID=2067992 RepID=UPI003D1355CE